MCREVEDRRGRRANAEREEHVAELAHGRVRHHPFDVELHEGDRRREDRGDRSNDADDLKRWPGRLEEGHGSSDQVHARCDHRRGMDERRYRGRTLHRVRQPRVQRKLRRLTGRPEEEGDADESEGIPRHRARLEPVEHVEEVHRTEGQEDRDDPDRVAPVPDAVHHERLLRRVIGRRALEPKADEQVAAEADALPAHEHQQVVVCHHEDQHREDEEREPREEPIEPGVVRHVAVRVHEDQERDDRDDEKHRRREGVDQRGDVDGEIAHSDPAVQRDDGRRLSAKHLEEDADRNERGEADRDRGDDTGEMPQPPAPEETVHEESRERERRDEPHERDHSVIPSSDGSRPRPPPAGCDRPTG